MNFKKISELFDASSKKQMKVAAWVLFFVIVFTSGVVTGGLSANKPVYYEGAISSDLSVEAPSDQSSGQLSAQPSEQPVDTDTGDSSSSQGMAENNGAAEENSETMTTAEIIELFNTSANKVKTDAVKVTKNFEKRTHMEEHLVLPEALEGMAKSLMEENFKDDTEPIEYATKEDIVANFQVPGETWSSQLTEAEVMSAACTDNGTEYEIYIKLHPSTNPEPGNGVAKAFDTITTSEVMAKAPSMVKEFTTEYYDCEIRCKIDKASGKLVWASYTSPLILKLKVEFFGTLDAQIGMKFEKDYSFVY